MTNLSTLILFLPYLFIVCAALLFLRFSDVTRERPYMYLFGVLQAVAFFGGLLIPVAFQVQMSSTGILIWVGSLAFTCLSLFCLLIWRLRWDYW